MKIALYSYHHHLPFWHDPRQPIALFDSASMRSWSRTEFDDDAPVVTSDLLETNPLWPILTGLEAIEMGALAHISLPVDLANRTFQYPKRAWVQITTMPTSETPSGLPLVVDNGKRTVRMLWAQGEGHWPYDLIPGNRSAADIKPEERTPEFWKHFFLRKLQEARREAMAKVAGTTRDAAGLADAFAVVPEAA